MRDVAKKSTTRQRATELKRVEKHHFWSRKLVISSIHGLKQRGVPINSYCVQRDFSFATRSLIKEVTGRYATGSALHQRGQYYFGTWNEALRSAGVDPSSLRKPAFWNEERFRCAVIALQNGRVAINDSDIRSNRSKETTAILKKAIGRNISGRSLFLAARHHLGSWERALRLAGLNPVEIRKRGIKLEADREALIALLRLLKHEEHPINRSAIKSSSQVKAITSKRLGRVISGASLLRASIKQFGSWDAALINSGFHLSEVRKRSTRCPRSADTFIEIVRALSRRDCALNASSVDAISKAIRILNEIEMGRDVSGNSLRNAAKELFGSWERGLWAAGLDSSEVCLRLRQKGVTTRLSPYQIEDNRLPSGERRLTRVAGAPPKTPERALQERMVHRLVQKAFDDFGEEDRAQLEIIFDEILRIHHYRDQRQLIDFLAQKYKGSISRQRIEFLFERLRNSLVSRGFD